MAKDRAFGADAVSLIAQEAVYGTPPDGSAGGVYRKMPMRSDSIGKEQPLEEDPTWNRGTPDDADPSEGAVDVSGSITCPVDVQGAGVLLRIVLGDSAEVDNGGGSFTHTFKSGADLHSWSRQLGHPRLTTPKWRTASGLKAAGLNFTMARNGRALFEIPMLGQKQVKDATGARDADPLIYAYDPFDNSGGTIKLAGVAVANVTGATFALSNGLEGVEDINPEQQLSAIDESRRMLTGTISLRFGNAAAIDDLEDSKGTALLELAFTKGTSNLKFQMPRTRFQMTKKTVEGPGGIAVTANWRAAYDSVSGYMLAALLTNGVASYMPA
jgi:hypothetical protein